MTLPASNKSLQPDKAGSTLVHQSTAHDSAIKHVTGRAIYIDDIIEPAGLLHVYFGTSKVAHGRIRSLNLDAVRSSSGVFAVLTAADIPGVNDISPKHSGDEEILASEMVHFYGQVLFAVAAESRDAARRAVALAKPDIEELPAVLDIETAMAQEHWVDPPHTMQRGDANKALVAAAHRLQGEIRTGAQDHFYLEGQAALSIPQEDGDVLIYSSSQHPTELQHLAALALGRADHAITVEVRRMGGAFGGKETQAAQWAVITALVANQTGRPAKLRLDRDDDMISTGKRHDFDTRYKVGFDNEGVLQMADARAVMSSKAFCGKVSSTPKLRSLARRLPSSSGRGAICICAQLYTGRPRFVDQPASLWTYIRQEQAKTKHRARWPGCLSWSDNGTVKNFLPHEDQTDIPPDTSITAPLM